MKNAPLLLRLTALLPLLLAACSTAAAASGSPGKTDCPVTPPPAQPFVPPEPWPAAYPYAGRVWYGSPGLWTALPEDGQWQQLLYGDKSWWWSEEFDVEVDSIPGLVVTARRLDGRAADSRSDHATNGFHDDFNWAMLTGLTVESPGCWEITGEYMGHSLTMVVWVPGE